MKRSKFSLSHYKLQSMKMGYLVPCGLVEVLPGDTIQHATNMLVRCQPLVVPVMHPCHVRIHHWFIPFRLIWDDWEKFITGGPDGMDASAFPYMTMSYDATDPDNPTGSGVPGGLMDYLGVPTKIDGFQVSALPQRAYTLVFNEWYRDQDLVPELPLSKSSGADGTTNRNMGRVAWEKDYFTTARPWTQKGPTVSLPLTGNAPVMGIGIYQSAGAGATNVPVRTAGDLTGGGGTDTYAYGMPTSAATSGIIRQFSASTGPNVYADLSNVSSATINELRLAMALQRYEEARARYGSRYTEYLRYLGVRSSDARLQRPEYLGGGKQTLQFSEILQTGPDDPANGNTVGALKGHGIGAVRSNRYRKFFEEHGYVLSLISVKPRTVYTQGLSRTWNRRVKEDFWQRELQHIGQQEILNKELYVNTPERDGVFGYQDRYDEYRRQESGVAGQFRDELDYWHMARTFTSLPVLNASFINAIPTARVFADQTGSDTLLVMVSHSIQARRMVAATGSSFIF